MQLTIELKGQSERYYRERREALLNDPAATLGYFQHQWLRVAGRIKPSCWLLTLRQAVDRDDYNLEIFNRSTLSKETIDYDYFVWDSGLVDQILTDGIKAYGAPFLIDFDFDLVDQILRDIVPWRLVYGRGAVNPATGSGRLLSIKSSLYPNVPGDFNELMGPEYWDDLMVLDQRDSLKAWMMVVSSAMFYPESLYDAIEGLDMEDNLIADSDVYDNLDFLEEKEKEMKTQNKLTDLSLLDFSGWCVNELQISGLRKSRRGTKC